MQKIVLIDSFAHIYRGFYALPPLSNSSGMPTNAIFAFAKTLLFVERNFPSSHGAAVFDKGRPLVRLKIAPDYKATRPPTPPDLLRQIPYAKQIAEAFGWKVAESDDTEADDIISSLCAKFAGTSIDIVSNDKDLAQLVNDNVQMLVSGKDGGLARMDKGGVLAKFAVRPEQIVDYLSLVGDSSDNIPGAPGVGPKTAAKLLDEFASLDNIVANIESVKGEKVRQSIVESLERLRKNRELIKLPSTNPFAESSELKDLERRAPEIPRVERLCEELGLRSVLAELKKGAEKNSRGGEQTSTYTPDLF